MVEFALNMLLESEGLILPAVRVSGFVHTQIQGVDIIPKITGLDSSDLNDFSLVVYNPYEELKAADLAPPPYLKLGLISRYHGRSYQVFMEGTGALFSRDENGNLFRDLTLKGNNLFAPHLIKDPLSPYGFDVYGMQDSDKFLRTIKASQVLRANNVDTEMIVGVIEPLELPYKGEIIPTPVFKDRLIQDFGERFLSQTEEEPPETKIEPADLPRASLYLENEMFVITLRSMQVAERLADLFDSTISLSYMLKRVFQFVNESERQKVLDDPSYKAKFFDSESDTDIVHYLAAFLPERIAKNYAILHNLNLTHGYTHVGNVSLTGSIYDLDSVKGESLGLGDEAVSEEDKIRELHFLLNGANETSTSVGGMGVKHVLKFREDKEDGEDGIFDGFRTNLLFNYIRERSWEKDILGNLDQVFALYEGFRKEDANVIHYYTQLVYKQLGWEFGEIEESIIEEGFVYGMNLINESILKRVIVENPNEKNFHNILVLFDEARVAGQVRESENDDKAKEFIFHLIMEERGEDLVKAGLEHEIGTAQLIAHLLQVRLKYMPLEQDNVDQVLYRSAIPLYKNVITHLGWEDDLVPHLSEIREIFNEFGNTHMKGVVEHYLSLLSEQVGLTYNPDYSIDELVDWYLGASKEEINDGINDLAQFGLEFVEPQDHVEFFLNDFLHMIRAYDLKDDHINELGSIIDKYGQETGGVIVESLQKMHYLRLRMRLEPFLTEEIIQRINTKDHQLDDSAV